MSKRHTALSRERGGLHVLKQDEIWDASKDVLYTLPICKIASADVSAFNIAGDVLKERRGEYLFRESWFTIVWYSEELHGDN